MSRYLIAALVSALVAGCAASSKNIANTEVPDNAENRGIIERVEEYRLALERQDAAALLSMASRDYWEDGGTPTGADDYGFKGLKQVLTGRLQQAENIRYSIRYVRVRRREQRAFVEALVHASWTIRDAYGQLARRDKKGQEQFVLEWDGEKWMFLSGM
jgi:hypothetical protein